MKNYPSPSSIRPLTCLVSSDCNKTHEYIPYFDSGRLETTYPAPGTGTENGYWFIFCGNEILVPEGDGPFRFGPVHRASCLSTVASLYIGRFDGVPCNTVELEAGCEPPENFRFSDIKGIFGRVSDDLLGIAGRSLHILSFNRSTKFCGVCGTHNHLMKTELAKQCPGCGHIVYPRLSPAIIVLVYRDDEILLARSPGFPTGMYSVIAGFVEPGETIEHAVHREVMEETGICVCGLRYVGSQPWPFPDSLMIGFVASYDGGVVRADKKEIEDARWFKRGALPELPGPLSISRALIDWFEKGNLQG
jgi:NAD+ diphosphatase